MPDLIITDALVERCAQAADDARSDRYGLARRPLADMHPEKRADALAKNIQRLGIAWPAALTAQRRLHA